MAKIISAFPGTGKTYFYKNVKLRILDSDSSKFSWIKEGVRNPFFPDNYIGHIKNSLDKTDIILVSSHKIVRDALVKERLEYYLVYPNVKLKEEYIERFIQRGSPKEFVDLISKNWYDWISELEKQTECIPVKLSRGQYLSDIIALFV